MKTLFTFIFGIVLLLLYIYLPINSFEPEKSIDEELTDIQVDMAISEEVFSNSDRGFATEKLKNLTIANTQCKESSLEFGLQVQTILNILSNTLEHELRRGKTDRELLAYSGQFKTFYNDFDDLLLQARLRIESEKHRFTDSIDILNEWKGLSVLNGFSALNTPILVKALRAFDGGSSGLSISLELDTEISKQAVLELLENEWFNTYLQSPLTVSGAPLSPSILFVLTATELDISEYKQAVSMQSFTVNDVAVAIENGMPYEYLALLIEQTASIEDMPTLLQGNYESYKNLADLAAANHNSRILKLLETYGVTPTNEPGIITGLDLAIMNLPDEPSAYSDLTSFPQRYLDTIRYLKEKGYRAHGYAYQDSEGEGVLFRAPNRRFFNSTSALLPSLRKALDDIHILGSSHLITQISADDSLVSKAIESIEIKKSVLNQSGESCKSIGLALLAEERFADNTEMFAVIKGVEGEENVAELLHEIDPALVNHWHRSRQFVYRSKNTSQFIQMLKDRDYEAAINYSASNPLSELETDRLLASIVLNFEKSVPIWSVRASHTQPSGLLAFTRLSIEQWESLMNDGFDFSAQDTWGNDFFAPASLHSPEAVQLLLNNGFAPNVNNLGLDALDLLLEDSYIKGRLHPSLGLMIQEVEEFESNHYARIERLKQFFPKEYQALIVMNKQATPPIKTEVNKFRLRND